MLSSVLVFWLLVFAGESFASNTIKTMFYNVENLFDYTHDTGKNDWAFLPQGYPGKKEACAAMEEGFYQQRCFETDWNKDKFSLKIEQIKRVVVSGGLPDILGMCEVENDFVATRLAASLGYARHITTAGPDPRGIDIVLFYKERNLRYLRHREYQLKVSPRLEKPTRNILEVEFLLPVSEEKLVVYVVHWPSPRHPDEARMVAARNVISLIGRQMSRNWRVNVLVMGDFNVLPGDHPNPLRRLFAGRLHDAHTSFFQNEDIELEDKKSMPIGTYFYPPKMSWDVLDHIFSNANLHDGSGLEVDSKSYRILAPPYLTTTYVYDREGEFLFGSKVNNVPRRYNFNAESAADAGFSDHFAVLIDLIITPR